MTSTSPERALILAYAPVARRAALAALLGLDDALARLLATTREPAIGQMRLAWWHESLSRLDRAPAPAEPVLAALAREALPLGAGGEALAGMIEGWDVLIEADRLDDAALARFAEGRGARLFGLAAQLLGASPDDPAAGAGRGWALADLAGHLSEARAAERAGALAHAELGEATRRRWSRNGRALGAMAHLARLDLMGASAPGSPRRVGRLLWHRLSGW